MGRVDSLLNTICGDMHGTRVIHAKVLATQTRSILHAFEGKLVYFPPQMLAVSRVNALFIAFLVLDGRVRYASMWSLGIAFYTLGKV